MAGKKREEAFEDEGGESPEEAAALERNVARVREAAKRETEAEPGEDELEIPGEDQEDDEREESRGSRRERRRERGELHRAVQQERERNDRLEREVAELRGRVSAPPPVPAAPAAPTEDPLDQESKDLRRQWQGYAARYQQALQAKAGQQQIDALDEEGWQIRDRMNVNAAKRALKESGGGAPSGMTPQQMEAHMTRTRLMQDHGDVMSDQRRAQFFMHQYGMLVAKGKSDKDWSVIDEAMELTRKEFRLPPRGGRPAPSEATRRRHTAMPRGGGGSEDTGRDTIRVSSENRKEIERIANVTMRYLPKEKRLPAYLKQYGSRIRKHVEKT